VAARLVGGSRGTRTDFTPYMIPQSGTMNPIGEIRCGHEARAITAMEGLSALTDDKRMALVIRLTPASSVTVATW